MSDLSTYAGQAQHYAGIKAKFAAIREPEQKSRVRHVPLRLRSYSDLQRAPTPAPVPPKPVVILTPLAVSAAIVRDVIFVSSSDFIDRGSWKDIALEVATKHRVTLQEIKGPQRNAYIVLARHELFWRMAHETTLSLPEIGRKLGGRDHTTVIHGMRRHAERNGLELRERARLRS